jgi:hypothetical protein
MKKIKNTQGKVIIIVVIFLIVYSFLFWNIHTPLYGKGFDTYQHISLMKIYEDKISKTDNYNESLYPGLYADDFHMGLNIFSSFTLKQITGATNLQLIYLEGMAYSILLIFALYLLIKKQKINKNRALMILITFLLFSAGSLRWIGRFNSFFELLIVAHYPATLGLGLILLMLSLNWKLEENLKIYILNALLFTILFSAHLLSGLVYLVLFGLLLFIKIIKKKKFNVEGIKIMLIYLLILFLLSFWPFFNWVEFFINSNPIQGNELETIPLGAGELFGMFGLLFFGFLYLLKKPKQNLHLLMWSSLFTIFLLSYLTPFRISSYWRFLTFIKIPLIISTTLFAFELDRKKLKIFFIFCLLLFSFISLSNNVIELETKGNNYNFIEPIDYLIPNNSIIFGNPFLLYNLQAIGDKEVFLIADGHAGSINSQIMNRDRLNIWRNGCKKMDKSFYQQFDYFVFNQGDECKLNFLEETEYELLNKSQGVEIYKLKNEN